MPLYEYECRACGERFERIQKVADEPLSRCPSCGGSLRRLLGAPALQFKGSGWYVTDYPKTGAGGNGEKKEKPPADRAAEPATKGESTSAAGGDGAGSGSTSGPAPASSE